MTNPENFNPDQTADKFTKSPEQNFNWLREAMDAGTFSDMRNHLTEGVASILPVFEIGDEKPRAALRNSPIERIEDELATGKLDETTFSGKSLQRLLEKASYFGEARMDRLVEKINGRLEPYGRQLKLTPDENGRRPADYELTLYDIAKNQSLGTIEIDGRGRK